MRHNDINVLVRTRLLAHHRDFETVSEVVLCSCSVDVEDVDWSSVHLVERDLEVVLGEMLETVESVLVVIQGWNDSCLS